MNDELKASPVHTASEMQSANLEKRVDQFEAQMNGWILDHATALTEPSYPLRENAGYAILLLVTAYFEAIEPYLSGAKNGKSHEVFRAGFRKVFPELAHVPDLGIDSIYGELRCGLYHAAATGRRIQISHLSKPFELTLTPDNSDLASAVIDPWQVLDHVKAHLQSYVAKLKDVSNVQLRDSFEAIIQARPQVYVTFIPQKISSTF